MLLDFFQYEFLTRALMAGMLIGLLAPIVGLFLVVRRFSLLADTLSHVSLLGVALALFFKLPLFLGALVGSLLGGVGMEWLRRSGKVMNEAVLALFLSGSLAAALVFLASVQGVNLSLFSYLFGSITTVSEFDLWWLLALVLLVIIFLILTYRKLFLVALDEDLARVDGVAVDVYNFLFILLASLVVAAAFPIVGVLLIGALMIVPVLTAMQWHLSFRQTLFLSIVMAELSVVCGFTLSYHFSLPSGATIVLTALALFAASFTINSYILAYIRGKN